MKLPLTHHPCCHHCRIHPPFSLPLRQQQYLLKYAIIINNHTPTICILASKSNLTCKILLTLITERLFSTAFFSKASSISKLPERLSVADGLLICAKFFLKSGLNFSNINLKLGCHLSYTKVYVLYVIFCHVKVEHAGKGGGEAEGGPYNLYRSVIMSAITDNFPLVNAPESSGKVMNEDDIFVLDGADLLDTLLLTSDCVSYCMWYFI